MNTSLWRISGIVAIASLVGSIVVGVVLGSRPAVGQYAGLDFFYAAYFYCMLAAAANGVTVFAAFGLGEHPGLGRIRPPAAWILGAILGVATCAAAFFVTFPTILWIGGVSHRMFFPK